MKLFVNDELTVISLEPDQTLRELAVMQGMRTMSSEAMAHVAGDVTTIDEVIHNVYIS